MGLLPAVTGLVFLLAHALGDSCEKCFQNFGWTVQTLPEVTSCSSKCDDGIQYKIKAVCCNNSNNARDCYFSDWGHCQNVFQYWGTVDDETRQEINEIYDRHRNICSANNLYWCWTYLEPVKCGSNPCQNNGTCSSSSGQYTCDCSGTGFYGLNCETNECKPIPTDIVFVLDSSTSMTNKEFDKQLQFVSTFIGHIEIGPDDFRVGMVTFSFEAKVEFGFDDYLTNDSLKTAINRVKFRRGVTFTHLGLSSAEEMFKTESLIKNGSVKLDRKKYVIVLTDGMSTDRKKTQITAASLKKTVHKVIAIGIGYQVSHKELLTISSPPDGASSAYVFSVDDFNSLNTILKELVQLTCDKCDTSSLSDVIFLIDTSHHVNEREFQTAISSITYIIQNLKNTDRSHGTNVGIVAYDSYEGRIVLALNNSNNKNDLLPFLQRLTKGESSCKKDGCGGVPNDTLQIVNEALGNERERSRRFLVILSNGNFESSESSLDKLTATIGPSSNVNKFVIGVGEDINMERLLLLVNDPNHVYITSDDNGFQHLDILQAAFTYNECDLK